MGAQQLLLIALATIIVGVAVFVAIVLFKGNSQSSNRDAVIADLENLATTAQQYYRKPTTLAGGGYDYLGFNFMGIDTGNENGSYSVTASLPTGTTYVPGSTSPISVSTHTLYIVGCGKMLGDDGVDPVKVYLAVTNDSLSSFVLN